MEFFANELSIHQQFGDLPTFRIALERLMAVRSTLRRWGRDVHCHRSLLDVEPIRGMPMRQAVQGLAVNDRRALMVWLTRGGPFWDELRRHEADEYLECRGDVVTDSAVGEAAYRTLHGVQCSLASVVPSDWDYSPIEVLWRREAEGLADRSTALDNWRDPNSLKKILGDVAPSVQSWADLQSYSLIRFKNLTFAGDCFEALAGRPFVRSAADRVLVLLGILDRFAVAFDANGERTPEGHQIYQDYFTGIKDNAWFSDSSDSEKRDFRHRLTFSHPEDPGKSLLCTWHGKERRMTLRLHFSWPVRAGEPVYVVYVGPKLTKR